jgi:hypothetical protein
MSSWSRRLAERVGDLARRASRAARRRVHGPVRAEALGQSVAIVK